MWCFQYAGVGTKSGPTEGQPVSDSDGVMGAQGSLMCARSERPAPDLTEELL